MTYGLPNSGAEMNLYDFMINNEELYGLIIANSKTELYLYPEFISVQVAVWIGRYSVRFGFEKFEPFSDRVYFVYRNQAFNRYRFQTEIDYYYSKIMPHYRDLYIWLNQ